MIGGAVQEVLDEINLLVVGGLHIRHVTPPPVVCRPQDECLPLAPVLGTDPVIAGHLHRPVDRYGQSEPCAAVRGIEHPDACHRRETTPSALTVVGHMIAAHVGRDLFDLQLAHSRDEVHNLHVALESNRLIGVAVGVLMTTRHCTATQAFDLLKVASQNQNRKLRHIASEVQYTGSIPTTPLSRQRT